ncbi:MAG: M20/M25/M40 family metallo-hydrolase [bacterium]
MKTIFSPLVLFLAFGLMLNASQLKAQQYFDEKPAVPLLGKWYKDGAVLKGSAGSVDPFIQSCITQVNADSIRATLVHLQNYGTRFLLADNRKEIATWIMERFLSFGYTNVKLDSFLNYLNWSGIFIDTTWQYNVVCTMEGATAPAEEYIIGGHYDSFCAPDPFTAAPGANDNATAVAATFEIARIMKKMNYQPEATIKFILFGAEELGLFGSRYDAQVARETGRDIRYMLNMDMISNNPDSLKQVKIYKYIYTEWAADVMADVFSRYTDLDVFIPDVPAAGGSDSFSYWLWGWPTAYLEEMEFSPNWHLLTDSVKNCNTEYCAEITRGAFATLMEEQMLPYPQGLTGVSSKEAVRITWKPTANANVAGFNLYRSEIPGSGYTKLNDTLLAGPEYSDNTAAGGKDYYYILKTLNMDMEESIASNEVNAARFEFTDTLLVVATLKGHKSTPDSVKNYYSAMLDTIPFAWHEMNLDNPLTIGKVARYRNILWLINGLDFDFPSDTLGLKLLSFFENGGNMMFCGFTPSRYLAHNSAYPTQFDTNYFINRYFKVDSVNRKINSFMFRANPVGSNYDTLNVDSTKYMEPTFPGELYNIEVFTPAAGAGVIYRFDSRYPPNSSQGIMNGKAVGIEYLGEDFKTILISFPLYYIDTLDARRLMETVLKYKFTKPVGIPESSKLSDALALKVFPNPFRDLTSLSFTTSESSVVKVKVYNMQGVRVANLLDKKLDAGTHTLRLRAGMLPPGIYNVVVMSGGSVSTAKAVLIR